MNADHRRKRRKNTHFWRAFRFLTPYRRIVIISIISAVLVGFVFTSGMGAMLPIVKVLIDRDTIQGWVGRQLPKPVPAYLQWVHGAAAMLPTQPLKAIAVIFCIIAGCAIVGNVIRFFQ